MDLLLLTKPQLKSLLAKRESHFFDVKSKASGLKTVTKCLSAFANSDGGELWLGIAEHRSTRAWEPFDDEEDANAIIQEVEKRFPIGGALSADFVEVEGLSGVALHYSVRKAREVILASDGKAYVRKGAQSLPQDEEGLKRLHYAKGILSYETMLTNAPAAIITESDTAISFCNEIVPQQTPEKWLQKQMLLENGKPNVAGVVVFADEPQVVLPKAAIKLYRYNTTDLASRETLADKPQSIDGSASVVIKRAVERVSELTEAHPVLGAAGFESVVYPREAIHEIITNAIIHRDYSLNDDVHVRVFDNRIEVQSPGRLPAHITEKNILDERFSRHPTIVRMLNKFPDAPNKDVGEGLNTAFEAMRKLKLRDPEIQQSDNGVIVILKHEKLAAAEEIILSHLHQEGSINNSKARAITFIGSENKVKNIFNKLIDAGLIERVPGLYGNKTAYRLTAKGRSET